MDERQIQAVAALLVAWNPLGSKAAQVPDLNGYRTEAIDIISSMSIFGKSKSPSNVVAEVLDQAFGLKLTSAQCEATAKQVMQAVFGAY